MKTLIRRRVLRRLIWVCTVCQLPFYGSPDYNGLREDSFTKRAQNDFDTLVSLWKCTGISTKKALFSRRFNAGWHIIRFSCITIIAFNQQILWSDCADAQADLSLCLSHKSYCRFCRALAHFCHYSADQYHVFNHCPYRSFKSPVPRLKVSKAYANWQRMRNHAVWSEPSD